MAEWTAYCAPGRKVLAALSLMLAGEAVTEVKETQALKGSSDIYLINDAAIEDALRLPDGLQFEFREPSGSSRLSPFDPLRMLCEDMARERDSRPFVLPILGV